MTAKLLGRLAEVLPAATAESEPAARGRFGPAKVSGLYAKAYAVDGQRFFIGSYNFDERSARLNTEMGLVLDSRVAAARQAELFDQVVPAIAYELRLAPDGQNLQWLERDPSGAVTVASIAA